MIIIAIISRTLLITKCHQIQFHFQEPVYIVSFFSIFWCYKYSNTCIDWLIDYVAQYKSPMTRQMCMINQSLLSRFHCSRPLATSWVTLFQTFPLNDTIIACAMACYLVHLLSNALRINISPPLIWGKSVPCSESNLHPVKAKTFIYLKHMELIIQIWSRAV